MLVDELFEIMGNSTRRRMLRLLSERPFFKSELSEKLGVGQKAVNDHISLLRESGIVEFRLSRQDRGRPRKYVRLSKSLSFTASFGPALYETGLSGELEAKGALAKGSPGLEEMRVEARKTRAKLEKLESAAKRLRGRLLGISRRASLKAEKEGLDGREKAALVELVVNGGEMGRLERLSFEDLSSLFSSLQRRGFIEFDPSEKLWTIQEGL